MTRSGSIYIVECRAIGAILMHSGGVHQANTAWIPTSSPATTDSTVARKMLADVRKQANGLKHIEFRLAEFSRAGAKYYSSTTKASKASSK